VAQPPPAVQGSHSAQPRAAELHFNRAPMARPTAVALRCGEGQVSLCEVLDRVLNKGVVVAGDIVISVAGVDLVYLGLHVVLTSVETANRRCPAVPVASPAIASVAAPATALVGEPAAEGQP